MPRHSGIRILGAEYIGIAKVYENGKEARTEGIRLDAAGNPVRINIEMYEPDLYAVDNYDVPMGDLVLWSDGSVTLEASEVTLEDLMSAVEKFKLALARTGRLPL